MTNPVDVDLDELHRQAAEIPVPGEAPAEAQAAPGEAPAAAPADSWAPMTPAIVGMLQAVLVPKWTVSERERAEFGDALTAALDQAFPGGLGNERWAPYVRLALVGASIYAAHRDAPTGCLLVAANRQPAPPPVATVGPAPAA